MILVEMKQYIVKMGEVPLSHLASVFHLTPEMTKLMMQHWINKGVIEEISGENCPSLASQSLCGGCSGNCHTLQIDTPTKRSALILYRAISA